MKNFVLITTTFLFTSFSAWTKTNFCHTLYEKRQIVEIPKSRPENVVSNIFKAANVITTGQDPDIVVNDKKFYTEVLKDPELNIGETYMDGLWDSKAIDQFIAKIMRAQNSEGRLSTFLPILRTPELALQAILNQGFRHFRDKYTNRQTRTLSKNVAVEHYDIGNELYRRMLDPTLTYTSGVWADGYTLEDAQNAKYDLIARKLGLKKGDHVLDIGSGFGGFARFAAKHYGAKVTGITISVEQLKAARALSSGIEGVNFIFSDYRDIKNRFPKNTFDHVVSIEMIEAVGVKNLNEYFSSASASLKKGGRFVIQAIASNRDVYNSNAWFSKYIFSDGVAPSNNQVNKAAERYFGKPADQHRITSDYDKTLLEWHKNFTQAWSDLKENYSARFKRMWDFYLLSVAGAFRAQTLQLDQVVYVKGGPSRNIEKIRDLPTRDQLDKYRLESVDINKTKVLIGELETRKKDLAELSQPKIKKQTVPLNKTARIAIIGAGPSGLSAALQLKKLGYQNVVIYEKEAEAGGKSHTVDIEGKKHDLGATMGVKFKYRAIEQLAKEAGQETIPFPTEVQYNLEKNGPESKMSFSETVEMGIQSLVYLIQHHKLKSKGPNGLEVPTDELADPFTVVMQRFGLDRFNNQMKTYLTGYGYGGPETPAVFGMRMLDASAILGAALAPQIMWKNGTQPIWKHLAKRLNVRTNSEVSKIERDGDDQPVKIYLKDSAEPQEFDKVIMAVDPETTLKMLDTTPEEISLFSQVKYMPYATFAVRVDGLAEGKSEVGYLKENMTLEKEGRPMAWIKRHADDNVFVVHLFAPRQYSDEQIVNNIKDDLQKLGATNVTYVDSRRWPFFPHVDSQSMREEHFYQRVHNLQGTNNTVFVNEALGMSTMPDSFEQGKNAANRLASGEY